jgi:hypothetical protein
VRLDRSSFDTVLTWLPSDTETVACARNIPMPTLEGLSDAKGITESNWSKRLAESIATPCPLRHLREGKYHKSLLGQQLTLAVDATRNIHIVDAWGGQRYEGCSVLEFQNDLGPLGTKLEADLRRDCKRVQHVFGQTVFVFEPAILRKHYVKDESWEGTFICHPAPNLLLIATQERFLREVLERRKLRARDRALPDELPIWKSVDRQSSCWMIRHVTRGVGRRTRGVAWSLKACEKPPTLVLAFSPDDANSAQANAWAVGRILEWATKFEVIVGTKKNADGTAVIKVALAKAQPDQANLTLEDRITLRAVPLSFFLMTLQSDPVVVEPGSEP